MVMMMKWIYRTTDNQFLYGGPYDPSYDAVTQGLVVLARNPTPRTERFDGAGGIRPATAQELSDYDAEQGDSRALGQFNGEKLVKAVAIWTAGRLNVPMATARQEILTILKGL